MSTTDSYNWKIDAQIREQEYRQGYAQEAAAGGLRPSRRNDGSDRSEEYLTNSDAAHSTGLNATKSNQEGYNPSKRLPVERYENKEEKFKRLWLVNAGLDRHRVERPDRDLGKADKPANYRARFVRAVATTVGFPPKVVDRCTDLARQLDPRPWNFCGGFDAFILGVVAYAADERDFSLDREAFESIREEWELSTENLNEAIEKVDNRTT